jgi:hypothetical protein
MSMENNFLFHGHSAWNLTFHGKTSIIHGIPCYVHGNPCIFHVKLHKSMEDLQPGILYLFSTNIAFVQIVTTQHFNPRTLPFATKKKKIICEISPKLEN